MSATFSINIGQLTEATRKPDIFSVLNDIQDNTQKLISPRDVRDAVLSTWANTPFKVTTPNSLSNYEYIGIDSTNPSNRDIKQKILLGKRSFGGLDVMNSSLLNSDVDIFLFNTKQDSLLQDSTKLAILAGTLSNLYTFAPYIESKVNLNETAIDLNIVNPAPNGAINILSNSGRIAINGIIFPTMAETVGSASNGMILRYRGTYPNGYFKWEEPTISLNNIGTPGYPTNIYGSTVSVNGYSIEFIDENLTPTKLGGVPMGFNFPTNSFYNNILGDDQNWPVTEVLRKILYPYIPPILQISAINNTTGTIYAEVGTTPSVTLTYSITTYARNYDEMISYGISSTNINGLTFSGLPGATLSSTYNTSTFSNIVSVKSWGLSASDNTFGFSGVNFYIATASISFINPVYYGFTNSILTNNYNILTKSITPYPGLSNSISFNYNGSGYLYFVCPSTFTPLSQIQDPNGFIIYDSDYPTLSAFTQSIQGSYIIYRTKHLCDYPGEYISQNSNFKFIF